MIHSQPHPLAGQVVKFPSGGEYRIEDYWDRVTGGSWMDAQGNPAALDYAMRSGLAGLPIDDEVVYGKVTGVSGVRFGHLLHVSELGDTTGGAQ